MLIVTIPPELMYIIIEFINTRDIRVLNKIEAFKYYRPIFNKYIEKERRTNVDFYQIGTIEMGLNLDSRRWGTYLVNVYKDKLDFFKHLLPNIKEKPIEKSIKQFFKIVKIMIEKYGHSVTNNIVSPLKYKPSVDDYIKFRMNAVVKSE